MIPTPNAGDARDGSPTVVVAEPVGVVEADVPRWQPGVWGWAFDAWVAFASIVFLYALSVPDGDIILLVVSVLALFGLAATWVGMALISLFGRLDLRWLLAAPAIVVVTIGLVFAQVPVKTRFIASRASFEAVAEDPTSAVSNTRIGLYDVGWVTREGTAVRFPLSGGGFLGESGFAYLPDGVPPDRAARWTATTYEHVVGDWYSYAEPFD